MIFPVLKSEQHREYGRMVVIDHHPGGISKRTLYYDWDNGVVLSERWSYNEHWDRPGVDPVIHDYTISYRDYITKIVGSIGSIKYRRNGALHRDQGPAEILYSYPGGYLWKLHWYQDGRLHRENQPACIELDEDGRIEKKEWCLHGMLYREKGPHGIVYAKNGNIHCEYKAGSGVYSPQGANLICYYLNGSVRKEEWWESHLPFSLHREGVPAIIEYEDA